ncbi:50S ribosomal protein L20 [Aliicoccus persicus]|uniref:Large ribosomal subunit protein bL20 n=1 Tax=Aliicoccus persicus TaxID=930138 RepID=A0A662Z1R7_9STAP|nr:50S ribosomal protein L20 [Aliicoccus persicus]SEV86635.1 LSU ribosomal protein L20P [Aliicoccus persicus]HJE20099.1 50S ribosomal protein L20 [Aliicoccus persicus]
MVRVKNGMTSRKRRKKVLKQAKGYFGAKSKLYRTAKQAVTKSGQYAYRDRRQKKRDFRRLWITRINAAARQNDISYNRLMNGLKVAGIDMNRKMLSEIAISNPDAFAELATKAKDALAK